MKKILILLALILCVGADAQVRSGLYLKDGRIEKDDIPTQIGVELSVKTVKFTPGVYARYAQKYLGVRAQLSERAESEIVSARIVAGSIVSEEKSAKDAVREVSLPENRLDNRIESAEQQAKTTSDLIFSLRKHRMELITGEAGEHVFGEGLDAALKEMARLENIYLEMFFGHTEETVQTQSFNIIPSKEERDCIIARFRSGIGIVPVSDLSGEAIALHMEPKTEEITDVQTATAKDRSFTSVVFPASTRCTLMCGMNEIADRVIPIVQFGQTLDIVIR